MVSVVLPTCDRPALVSRAVESVLAQEGVALEVVLVDSNRQTRRVADEHAAARWIRDERVRIIPASDRKNAAAVRNAGLDAARGEWVSYLDDDDAYRPGKLVEQWRLISNNRAPLVLCGAEFQLGPRRRKVQCDATEWRKGDLLLRARWNTPLLFHRATRERFDERLSPGEDAEFAHRLLARGGAQGVPVVPRPLVEIHPQPGPRVNRNADPVMLAAARILALRPGFYSRGARRRYILQNLLAGPKARGDVAAVMGIAWRLLRESRGTDWRPCANAVMVSTGLLRRFWVS